MKLFDLINTPLSGTNLIEASAGTGKTYTISSLFLRMILEKHFTVDRILVVTFTRAATEELKERIRCKLLQAKEAFSNGSSDDILINALLKKQKNPASAIQLIRVALIDFDRAPIFTIHGFCQRILHENAFETGSLFDTELINEQASLMQSVTDDFWRKHFYTAPPEFISYAVKKMSGPEDYLNLLLRVNAPTISVIPDVKKPFLENLQPFRKDFQKLKSVWPVSRDKVKELLMDPSLSGKYYGSLKADENRQGLTKRDIKVIAMLETMDRLVDSKHTGFPLFKDFGKFTATKLMMSVKKNHIFPSHKFFDICDELYVKGTNLEAEIEKNLLFLKTELFKFAKSELLTRKRKNNIQFFDDLLTMVKEALQKDDVKRGNPLATAIRQKYKAALVDEFQDTDPIQYEIFSRLFTSEDSVLFMIGDPKQAIYGFRGADIFSYMKAAKNADAKYTLSENWRSEPGLIKALNTIFSRVKDPFVFDEIPFEEGMPAKGKEPFADLSGPPLKFWYLDSQGDKPINKTDAVNWIASAIADEISLLVSHGTDQIKEGDIAVLVRTNRQAQIIKEYLSAKGIPSVLHSAGNIFDSHEAMEMERLLSSISEPANERRLKSAIATDMMGVTGEKLDSTSEDTFLWESRLGDFREYFHLWNRYGFIKMFRMFMAKEKVKGRLLSFSNGERRLTNVLHLAEILHKESMEKNLGTAGLIKWLSEQRNPTSPRLEEHQLRLENDDNAITIITIHKSKGLEYKIIFCPFGWEGSEIRNKEIIFHDNSTDKNLKLDLGSEEFDANVALAQNELLAENLRLLYVALTRAKMRCYLVWGRINTAETSAMAYLFHYQGGADKDNIIDSVKKSFSGKKDEDLLIELEDLVSESEGTIKLSYLPIKTEKKYKPQKEKKEKLSCRRFAGKIDKTWRISSYSSLVSRKISEIELPDRDAFFEPHWDIQGSIPDYSGLSGPSDFSEQYAKVDIFSFPKGSQAGILFHDIFEHLDFAEVNYKNQERLVTEKLKEYGFDLLWKETVYNTIKKVLSVPLLMEKKDLFLSSIQWEDRINEMEFYFPLKPVTPQRLKRIFADHGTINISSGFPGKLGKLTFLPTEGFMKGYIDLIFFYNDRYYLVDWKSNFLGKGIECYKKDSLYETMKNEFYILQYHIYVLALHQYLRLRMPGYRYESNFGGVFYIFLRGVDPEKSPEFGIYNDLPNIELVNALGRSLIPGY